MTNMSLGLILQMVGGTLSIIGIVTGLIGVYLSPQGDNIFNFIQNISVRNFFSDTQSIKVLPPSLGGNDQLNLDNVATLQLHVPYSESSITLLLDVVTTSFQPATSEGVTVEGARTYNHNSGTTYLFDTENNKRHRITIGERNFVVTLLRVKLLDVPDVPVAREYEFGISEE